MTAEQRKYNNVNENSTNQSNDSMISRSTWLKREEKNKRSVKEKKIQQTIAKI
jgi:hypothetical protein